jgi:hypothetical protein
MFAAWYGGGDQQGSRVDTLGMGRVFLAASLVRPVGTSMKHWSLRYPEASFKLTGLCEMFRLARGWAAHIEPPLINSPNVG